MNKRITVWKSVTLLAAVAACGGTVELDTRTFEVQSIPVDEALMIIEPYVYGDRPNAPGTASAMRGLLTVRETPDNLDKIARVLSEFDVPSLNIRLHIQLISANGARTTDPAIAELEAELRQLFRFDGYELVAEGVLTGLEGSHVQQVMFDQRGQRADPDLSRYFVGAYIGDVAESGDSAVVTLPDIQLESAGEVLFTASVALGIGHTVMLGTMQLTGNRALILAVRAELVK
ncbi:MAG: hypothetical protein O7I93_00350 [Gemmatimonadetes bacterium]|nr:hypothetical protein [Gemmatimonadota bacterium]